MLLEEIEELLDVVTPLVVVEVGKLAADVEEMTELDELEDLDADGVDVGLEVFAVDALLVLPEVLFIGLGASETNEVDVVDLLVVVVLTVLVASVVDKEDPGADVVASGISFVVLAADETGVLVISDGLVVGDVRASTLLIEELVVTEPATLVPEEAATVAVSLVSPVGGT